MALVTPLLYVPGWISTLDYDLCIFLSFQFLSYLIHAQDSQCSIEKYCWKVDLRLSSPRVGRGGGPCGQVREHQGGEGPPSEVTLELSLER